MIFTIETIQARARYAHARGAGRVDHGFNWDAEDAIKVWQAEWDKCERLENCAFFRRQAEVVTKEAA